MPPSAVASEPCYSYELLAPIGQHYNRRCGLDDPADVVGLPWANQTSCGLAPCRQTPWFAWNDTTSPLCAGSDARGFLRGLSVAEMQARCAALGAGCAGYAMTGDETLFQGKVFVPYTGWLNWVGKNYMQWLNRPLLGNWSSWRRRTTCAASRRKAQLRRAMQVWMAELDEAMSVPSRGFNGGILRRRRSDGTTLAHHRELLGGLVRRHVPMRLSGLPCFYPFGGADLLTATALVPDAPHYIIVSKLPLGDPECFLSAECRSFALETLREYFNSWEAHFFAWTETTYMTRWFSMTPAAGINASLGVLPVLVASLAALGHNLTGLETHGSTGLTLITDTTRVTYLEHAFEESGGDLPEMDRLLGGRQHVSIFKAAEVQPTPRRSAIPCPPLAPRPSPLSHGTRPLRPSQIATRMFNSEPWLPWLLRSSVAVLSDITGPQPSSYDAAGWHYRTLGNLTSYVEAYNRLRIPLPNHPNGIHERLWAAWTPGGGHELPTVFGYGHLKPPVTSRSHGHGAMVLAWRSNATSMATSDDAAGPVERDE